MLETTWADWHAHMQGQPSHTWGYIGCWCLPRWRPGAIWHVMDLKVSLRRPMIRLEGIEP